MGAALRDRRGASPGAPGLQGDLQPGLDHRAARLQDAGPGPLRSARPGAHGRISANRCLTTVDRYTAVLVGEPVTPDLVVGLAAVLAGIWIATTEVGAGVAEG